MAWDAGEQEASSAEYAGERQLQGMSSQIPHRPDVLWTAFISGRRDLVADQAE